MILDITMPHLDGIGVLERLETMDVNPRPYYCFNGFGPMN